MQLHGRSMLYSITYNQSSLLSTHFSNGLHMFLFVFCFNSQNGLFYLLYFTLLEIFDGKRRHAGKWIRFIKHPF